MPVQARADTAKDRGSPGTLLACACGGLFLLLLCVSCASVNPPPPEQAAVSARYENRPAPAAAQAAPQAPAPQASGPKADTPPLPATGSLQAPALTPNNAPAQEPALRLRDIPPASKPGSLPLGTLRPVPSGEVPNAPAGNPRPVPDQNTTAAPPPGDTPLPPLEPGSDTPLTLSDCVRLAVEHSPYLKGPAIEVEVRKLDEKDAWYRLFPSLNFIVTSDRLVAGQETKYRKVGDTYNSLGLSSGSYNPIAAWVQHDTQKDVTKLAKMGQILSLQELILQLANAFIALDNLDRQIAARKELIELAEKGLIYATRLENVQTSNIDIRIAQQRLALAHAEYEFLLGSRLQVLLGLKDTMGVSAYDRLKLDQPQFRDVVLPLYKLENYDLAYAQRNSIKMRMQEVRTELAKADVKAQWIKFMPTLTFMVRRPDQVNTNTSSNKDSYYLTTNVQIPLWQWGESLRGVDKAELRQLGTDFSNEVDRLKFNSSWTMQKMQTQQQATLLQLAETEVILADLNYQKGETEYQGGRITGRQLLDLKINVVQARIKANDMLKNYQGSLLQVVSETGDLMKRFVNIEDVENE